MKILYFANVRMPTEKAHGLQIIKMCEAFSRHNVSTELIVPRRLNKTIGLRDTFEFYRIEKIFKVKKLWCFDPVFLMSWGGGIYIKVQGLLFLLSIFLFLIFKKNKSSYFFYTRDIYLLPCLNWFSDNVIWEAHDLPKNIKFYLPFINRSRKIVSITTGLKRVLVDLEISEKKIIVASDGVDLSDFEKVTQSPNELRKELLLPLDKKIIMYAGHLYQWKGVDVLADAAGEFDSTILFVFIGGTVKDLERLKEKYADVKNIVFLGLKPHAQIPKYLKSADVLVLPNSGKEMISKIYTSPLKLFEYLAAGKPIIASDLLSLREVLDDCTAVFFEPDNSQSLALKIKNILQDEKKITETSLNSVKKSRQYSWDIRAKNILDFIKELK